MRGIVELALGAHYLVLSQHLPVFNFNARSEFRFDLFLIRHGGLEGLVRLHVHQLNIGAHEGKYLGSFLLDHRDFDAGVNGADYVFLRSSGDADGYDSGFRGSVFARLGFFEFDNFAWLTVYDNIVADLYRTNIYGFAQYFSPTS